MRNFLMLLFVTLLIFVFAAERLLASETKTAAETDFYQPSHTTGLRAPAVPIILSDPYLSIWSPYDKLTDGSTQHWTNSCLQT